MVIYLLTALFLGGFGNYMIPLMVGARDMVFPLPGGGSLKPPESPVARLPPLSVPIPPAGSAYKQSTP